MTPVAQQTRRRWARGASFSYKEKCANPNRRVVRVPTESVVSDGLQAVVFIEVGPAITSPGGTATLNRPKVSLTKPVRNGTAGPACVRSPVRISARSV